MPKVYENGGKLYEAMISWVLSKQGIKYNWEETLPGVGVVSDFVLYKEDKPYMVLLVTHSNAESGTHMKFWRNIDELFDLKSYDPNLCVVNVTFFSSWKPELSKVESAVFDASFTLSDKDYSEKLNELTLDLLPSVSGKSKKDTVTLFSEAIKHNKKLESVVCQFEEDFVRSVVNASCNDELMQLWIKEQERQKKDHPFECSISDTWYKCSLIKLAFFTESERKSIYSFVTDKKPISADLRQKAKLFFGGTGRIGVFDSQIEQLVKELTPDVVEQVIKRVERDNGSKVLGYLDAGRASNILIGFVNRDLSAITTLPKDKAIDYVVNGIKKGGSAGRSQRNTFIDMCFVICKYLDKRFSYDVAVRESDIPRGSGPDRLGGIDKCVLGERMLDEVSLRKLAEVIWVRINLRKDYSTLLDEIIPSAIHQSYVTLVKHRTVNYLHTLIEHRLSQLNWGIDEREIKLRSCLSEYAGAPANTGDVTFTYSLEKDGKKVLLQVICAYTATHKHKELPGKLRAARYACELIESNVTFIPNPAFNFDAVILLLDGCWSSLFSSEEKIADAFKHSGWNRVICIDRFMKEDTLAV